MTKERTRKTVEHYNTCRMCGCEFRVYAVDDPEDVCSGCNTKIAVGVAKEKLLYLIGATVVCIEPIEHGVYTSEDEIESVEIRLADGRHVLFSVAGIADDPYIEWNLRHQS